MKNFLIVNSIGLFVLLLAANIAAQQNQDLKTMQLDWTYFIGGSGNEGLGMLVSPVFDDAGMLWFAGCTKSNDFPTTSDAFDSTYNGGSWRFGTEDIFLVKFNTCKPGIVYSTFLGGANGPEMPHDIYVDTMGNVYIAGNLGSSDFPVTENALFHQLQGPIPGKGENPNSVIPFRHADGFLTILEDSGHKLKYSTYIGSSNTDEVSRVFSDPTGEIILFGNTDSPGFPSKDPISEKDIKDSFNQFVMRLDATGQKVLFSKLLPNCCVRNLQKLESGDYLSIGQTLNPDIFTTEGVFDRTYNGGTAWWGGDAYITLLSADLKTIKFATLFGGSGEESKLKIEPVSGGDFFIFGETTSKDLPVTSDAIEKTIANTDAVFLARFSGDGSQLKYCTYLGGKGSELSTYGVSLVYDGSSEIYVSGSTTSPYFTTTQDAVQPEHHGGRDGFILALDIKDNSLSYCSYLGGSKNDWGGYIVFDKQGFLYIIGSTESNDFPTHESNSSIRKGEDIFVSKFSKKQVSNHAVNIK